MSRRKSKYSDEFKLQALRLKKEVGTREAAKQLGMSRDTIDYWDRMVRIGELRLENTDNTVDGQLSIEDENRLLREQNRALERQHKKDQEKIDFLEEATAFFAASHPKLRKMNDLNL